jgi:hypothetical protein
MTTDISEKGLESLIVRAMTGVDGQKAQPSSVADAPALWRHRLAARRGQGL